MNGALLRKELRELLPWGVLSLALGLADLSDYLARQVDMLPLGTTFRMLNDASPVLSWFVALAIGTGIATRERDDGTLDFLSGLPVSRSRVFLVKCAVTATLVLLAPAMRTAAMVVMHLLSRGSLDHALHPGLVLHAVALQALLVVDGLMLGAAFGRLRSLTWLAAALSACAVLLLMDRVPRAALLDPLSLLDWQWSGGRLIVDPETVRVQIALTVTASLVAWRGFVRAGRSSAPKISNRPVVGAMVTVATVAAVVAVVVLQTRRAPPAPRATAASAPAGTFRFADGPPAQTVTRHYRFSYPANEGRAALELAAGADEIFERVHALLGVEPGAPIDVDASGSARNTHGTAYFGRLRMKLGGDARVVLAHETAHVVAQRLAGAQRDWLWRKAPVLNEGLASWVDAQFRGSSSPAEDRMLVLAAMHTRRELIADELATPALLAQKRDENVKYAAGEALIAAMVELYGDGAVARLLAAFGDARLPSDLAGLPLWQSTFQLAGMDLAAVLDQFYRNVSAYAEAHADRIEGLPRPRVRLLRFHDRLGVQALIDRPQRGAAAQQVRLRFKPAPDSPATAFRTYEAPVAQPIWRAPRDIAGGRICVQPGIAVGEEVLFEPWTCLPTSDAAEWQAPGGGSGER